MKLILGIFGGFLLIVTVISWFFMPILAIFLTMFLILFFIFARNGVTAWERRVKST